MSNLVRLLVAILLAVLTYWLCVAVGLPGILGVIFAAMVLLVTASSRDIL